MTKSAQDVELTKKNKELVLGIIESYKGQQSISNETIAEATESADIAKTLIAKIHGNRKFAGTEYDLAKKDIEDYISSIIHPISFTTEFCRKVLATETARTNLNKFTIRHYTTACPNQFGRKVKSYLALDIEKKVSLNKSGHTTGQDWNSIGNIGDTFYSLYYDGKLASINGIPSFINNAKYFIEWTLDEFEECWASGDWLGKETQPISYSGNAQNVVLASLINKIDLQHKLLNDSEQKADDELIAQITNILKNPTILTSPITEETDITKIPKPYLNFSSNFEIKKHGSSEPFDKYFDIENNRWVYYDSYYDYWKYYDQSKDSWIEWDPIMKYWKYYDKSEGYWKYYNEKEKCWTRFWM